MNRFVDNNRWTSQKLKNSRHTIALLTSMLLISSLLGWLFAGTTGMVGVLIATAASVLMAPRLSPRFMVRWFGARPLDPMHAPSLYANLRELTRRAGLFHMPTLYYVPTRKISAFTTGSREDAVIAITDGMLRMLNDRELAAVMAHEISHLKNNDLKLMNVSATFSQITSILSAIGQILLILNLQLILVSDQHISWVAIVVLILAPTLTTMLQLALSRTREFDADLRAALLTGDPQSLASALLKIEKHPRGWMDKIRWPGRSGPYDAIWNTHPLTRDRIDRLMTVAKRPLPHRSAQPLSHAVGMGFHGLPVRIENLTG